MHRPTAILIAAVMAIAVGSALNSSAVARGHGHGGGGHGGGHGHSHGSHGGVHAGGGGHDGGGSSHTGRLEHFAAGHFHRGESAQLPTHHKVHKKRNARSSVLT